MQLSGMGTDISQEDEAKYCVLEYLYRDAANYKAWGEVLLSGAPIDYDIATLRACLDAGEYFVAEQVGIPPAYQELWDLSGVPTDNDHALHEFVTVRPASDDDRKSLPLFASWSDLLKIFQGVAAWDCALSPNCNVDA